MNEQAWPKYNPDQHHSEGKHHVCESRECSDVEWPWYCRPEQPCYCCLTAIIQAVRKVCGHEPQHNSLGVDSARYWDKGWNNLREHILREIGPEVGK